MCVFLLDLIQPKMCCVFSFKTVNDSHGKGNVFVETSVTKLTRQISLSLVSQKKDNTNSNEGRHGKEDLRTIWKEMAYHLLNSID